MNRHVYLGRATRCLATLLLGLPLGSQAVLADEAIPIEPIVGGLAYKRLEIVDGPDPIDRVNSLFLRSGGSTAVPPVSPSGSVGTTEIAVDVPGGRALVTWSEHDGGGFRVAVAAVGDQGFLPSYFLSEPGPLPNQPSATFPGDGSAWLVYVQSDGTHSRAYRRTASATTGVWGPAEPVSLPGESVIAAHVVAHGGAVHVVYARPDGPATSIVHAVQDGTDWSREVVATTAHDGDVDPRIHSHAGALWIDWVDAQGPTGAGEVAWKRRSVGTWEPTRYSGYDSPFHRDYHVRPGIRLYAIAP